MSIWTCVYFRHGQTDYTGVFPDLTVVGKDRISRTAEEICMIAGDIEEPLGRIDLRSSPLPRALGSMDIVAQAGLSQLRTGSSSLQRRFCLRS
jgi:hypothetical protein